MFNPENAQNEVEFLNRKEVGTCVWNSIELSIPPTVYPPREDTDLLHEILNQIKPFGSKRLLEIGSGSGAISIAAAKHGWTVHACDINPYAVAATQRNAQQAGVSIEASEGGIGPIEPGQTVLPWSAGTYDTVVWNMPYIPSTEVDSELLGPMEEAALVDTHPAGLLTVFAQWMSSNRLCKMNGLALLVCRKNVDWKRSVDIFRQHGIASRIVKSTKFGDDEEICVLAAWQPFVSSKHHRLREIDSTNAELLRGPYSVGDSLIAAKQTSGRGRHGNTWQDHPESFKCSWMLNPSQILSITPEKQLLVAHEIRFALRQQEAHSQQLLVKWPNDLLMRAEQKEMWRKFGGVLFQSYSKGDEQRLVLGIGMNTQQNSLSSGQGSLEELGIHHSPSDLFPILNAVVASLFEQKHLAISNTEDHEFDVESILKACIYRGKTYSVNGVSSRGIMLIDDDDNTVYIDDDVDIDWINLHPQ